MHAICLLDMLINNRVEEPYSKLPPEGPLPILNKALVKSKLSQKFYKQTKYIYEPNSKSPEKSSSVNKNEISDTKTKIIENNKLEERKSKNNLKIKRAKTPTIKYTKLSNLNDSKNKMNYDKNNKNNIIKNHNKTNYKNRNNYQKITNNKNILKAYNNKCNIINKNNYNNNKKEYYYKNKEIQHEENIKSDNKVQLNILKETIFKLEKELNKKEKIIELQRNERIKLSLKIEELEKILLSIIPKNKYY